MRRVDRHPATGSEPQQQAKPLPPWPVVVMFAAWTLPWTFQIGALKLSPYRVVLIAMIVPCLVMWVRGKAGRIRTADIAVLLFSLWGTLSLTVLQGVQVGVQTGGVLFLETMGAYLVTRCWIRDADDFRGLARVLFWIVAILLPFAVAEAITGHNVILELFSKILPTPPIMAKEPRWGFRRVQAIFEHPILMGVCCSSVLALTHMVVGRNRSAGRRWTASAVVTLAAALAFSSGPWSGLAVQIALMGWNWLLRFFRPRWKLLIAIIIVMLLAVQLFAKRPLPNILFSAFAFEPDSAFFRILIWNFGTRSVMNHPWFGVGLGEWDRPDWMPPSIDMFWLYNAIIYGLPAGILMGGAFFAVVIPVGLLKGLDDRLYQYRAAFLISMAALFLMGWMVHYWNATYVLFMMLLGSGVWLLDAGSGLRDVRITRNAERTLHPRVARGLTRQPRAARRAAHIMPEGE